MSEEEETNTEGDFWNPNLLLKQHFSFASSLKSLQRKKHPVFLSFPHKTIVKDDRV